MGRNSPASDAFGDAPPEILGLASSREVKRTGPRFGELEAGAEHTLGRINADDEPAGSCLRGCGSAVGGGQTVTSERYPSPRHDAVVHGRGVGWRAALAFKAKLERRLDLEAAGE